MQEDASPAAMMDEAERVQGRMRRAGRWYPAMMAAFGVITVGIVAWIPALRDTWAGIAFALVTVAWAVGFYWWKSGRRVVPTSKRDMIRWVVAWEVLYIVAVSWFGPTFLDHTVGWWALMGVVVAVPAFNEAGRAWSRVRP